MLEIFHFYFVRKKNIITYRSLILIIYEFTDEYVASDG